MYDWCIGASRQEFLNLHDTVRREIRQARRIRRRYKVRILKDRALYEEWTTGPPPILNLECPDIKLIEPIIYRLGTDGIIDYLAIFDLYTPDPEYSVANISALAVHAFDFGRRFNKAETNSVSIYPLVFDTGVSTGLSTFKSDFLDNYKKCHIGVKLIAGGGSIVGGGTILRNFTTSCGTTLFLPAHGYHTPKADIRLDSPQYVIRETGDSGHAVIDAWNFEWNLTDKWIIDIPIDPGTNLPLIYDFFTLLTRKRSMVPRMLLMMRCSANNILDRILIIWISMSLRNTYSVAGLWHMRGTRIS